MKVEPDNVIFGEILEPEEQSYKDTRQRNVRERFWKKTKRTANKIPMMDEVVAAYFCAMDPKTPTKVRGTLLGALAYFIMPIDMIPDFLALVGFSDDIAVLSLAISTVSVHITDAHKLAAKNSLSDGTINDKTGSDRSAGFE